MYTQLKKYFSAALLVLITGLQAAAPASAYWSGYNRYNPYYGPYAASPYNPYSVFTRHPILSGTVVGSLVGAAGGAAVGALKNRGEVGSTTSSVGKDAAIGTGAGAALGTAVGLYRNVQIHRYYY